MKNHAIKHHALRAVARAAAALAVAALAACSTANSMMGGNTRQQALAATDWAFAKDAIVLEIEADPDMNRYLGEGHTLLLGVVQMADAARFDKLIADPAALGRQLGGGQSEEGFSQFVRYVVAPGQHAILLLDRVQNAKFVGIAAGYYGMNADSAARLFKVPVKVRSEGWVSRTYTAAPALLALRLKLGADGIVDAQRLDRNPAEQFPLDADSDLKKLGN